MASALTILTRFTAQDAVTPTMKGITANTQKFSKSMGGLMAAAFPIGGVTALALGMKKVISVGLDFEQTMVDATAKFPDNIRKGSEEFQKLEEFAKSASKTTEFGAIQVAEGYNFLAMAGFNAAQSLAVMPGILDLATASGTDLGTATDIATDSLGALGLMTTDTVQLQENLTRIMDIMSFTTTSANTDMQGFFETLKQAGPTGAAAGFEIEEIASLIGLLANSGIKASKAGTGLKGMFARLSQTNVQDKLAEVGVSVEDAEGNFLSMANIIGQLQVSLGAMGGDVERSGFLVDTFGTEVLTVANLLINEGQDSIEAYTQKQREAKGTTKELAETMRDTSKTGVAQMIAGFTNLATTIFTLLQPAFDIIVKTLTIATGVISTFMDNNSDLMSVLGALIGSVTLLGGAWLIYKGIMTLVSITTKAMTAATFALNIVMKANPIGLLITLVVGLVTAFVFLAKKAGGIGNAFKTIGNIILKFLMTPIRVVLAMIDGLLFLLSKIPGKIGDMAGKAGDTIDDIQAKLPEGIFGGGDEVTEDGEFLTGDEQATSGDEQIAALPVIGTDAISPDLLPKLQVAGIGVVGAGGDQTARQDIYIHIPNDIKTTTEGKTVPNTNLNVGGNR